MHPLKYIKFRMRGFSPYHALFASDDDVYIDDDFQRKCTELQKLKSKLIFKHEPIRIAVLGCADARYIPYYEKTFPAFFGKKIHLDIYDTVTAHLPEQDNVIAHDCTKTLPQTYDFVYSHILLNFLDAAAQAELLKSAESSLTPRGKVLHIYASDYDYKRFRLKTQMYPLSQQSKAVARQPLSKSPTLLVESLPYFSTTAIQQ